MATAPSSQGTEVQIAGYRGSAMVQEGYQQLIVTDAHEPLMRSLMRDR